MNLPRRPQHTFQDALKRVPRPSRLACTTPIGIAKVLGLSGGPPLLRNPLRRGHAIRRRAPRALRGRRPRRALPLRARAGHGERSRLQLLLRLAGTVTAAFTFWLLNLAVPRYLQ